jgi:hypothetical protein
MNEQGETRESVAAALEHGRSYTHQPNDRWRVHGNGLSVVVQIDEPSVIVWAVFAG